jgi:2-dehydropantoate 2-reductase
VHLVLGHDGTPIGAQDRQRTPAVERTRELLDGAGFPVAISDDIVADMWSKWAFIASAGAATCLLGGTAGEIAAAGGDAIARAIVEEAALVAAASGYPIPDTAQKQTQAMLTALGSPFASSMYRDLRQGKPVEVDAVLGDLLERGRRGGVRTPLLEAAAVALRVHNDKLASPARPPSASTTGRLQDRVTRMLSRQPHVPAGQD